MFLLTFRRSSVWFLQKSNLHFEAHFQWLSSDWCHFMCCIYMQRLLGDLPPCLKNFSHLSLFTYNCRLLGVPGLFYLYLSSSPSRPPTWSKQMFSTPSIVLLEVSSRTILKKNLHKKNPLLLMPGVLCFLSARGWNRNENVMQYVVFFSFAVFLRIGNILIKL